MCIIGAALTGADSHELQEVLEEMDVSTEISYLNLVHENRLEMVLVKHVEKIKRQKKVTETTNL